MRGSDRRRPLAPSLRGQAANKRQRTNTLTGFADKKVAHERIIVDIAHAPKGRVARTRLYRHVSQPSL